MNDRRDGLVESDADARPWRNTGPKTILNEDGVRVPAPPKNLYKDLPDPVLAILIDYFEGHIQKTDAVRELAAILAPPPQSDR